jgi:hypothetical protein
METETRVECEAHDRRSDDPTPQEIQRACQRIQARWSDEERRYRAALTSDSLDQVLAGAGPGG